MNKFYKEICKYYEDIFPLNKIQIDFLKNASLGKDYLDIGCATGLVAKHLEIAGKNLTCIDLENTMIEKAKEKGLNASVKNMLNLDFKNKFDLCYCIGTTIAHLNSLNEIYKFLDQIPNILKENGKLVLQWVNFSPFIVKNEYFLGDLPTLGETVKFTRNYYRQDDKIKFNTILTTDDGVFENTQLLVPLLSSDIVPYLEKLGFEISIYGDFKGSNFNIYISPAIILVASKK